MAVFLFAQNEAYAAVAYGSRGNAATGSTSLSVPYPGSIAANDLLILIVGNKYPTNGPTTPAGWTLVAQGSGGLGSAGADSGQVYNTIFVKEAIGTESGNLTVTITSANTSMARMFRYTKAAGMAWNYAATTGSDNTADTTWSITGAADPGITSGDVVVVGSSLNGNRVTNWTESISATGATFGATAERNDSTSGTGDDMGLIVSEHPVTAGTATAAPVYTMTGASGTANLTSPTGASVILRLREISTTTLATGSDPATATIAPGAAATDVDLFTLQTASGAEAITSVTVNLSTSNGVGRLAITNNAGTELGFTITPVTGSNTITVAGMSATTTLTTFKVRITPLSHAAMPAVPGAAYAITAPVTAWAGPNTHAGSDTNPNALTIDNFSPSGATSVSGSAGNAQVTLNWTTSASTDFSRSVVLRWTGGAAGTEVPAEGTNYVNGNTITTATVVCVRTADAASTAVSGVDGAGTGGCSATPLTNGQAYTYKIFQKDTSGNYDVGVLMGTITPRVTALGDGTNPSNVTIAPSAAITDLDSFTLSTSAGTDSVTALTVTLTGANSFEALSEVRITSSDGLTTYFSAVANPASNTVSFSGGTPIPVTTTATTFKVRITPMTHANMPAPPGLSYAVGGTVTAFTSTNGQSGTDSASATVTVDNLSPLGATVVSGSPGDMQVTLNWTTSASTDFSRSVVLRWTGGAAGTEVPAEGTNYVNGDPISTATVVCVRTADAASTAVSGVDGAGTGGCSATALTSGQAYTYKVFQKDSNGNYDVGVAVGAFTTLPRVVSINRLDTDPTSAATVRWTVTFSMSVTGVDASAFALAASGLSGTYITTVTGSGTTWTVTANTGIGIGSGTLGLNQTGPGSVVPTLSGTFTGQVYTITATPALAEYRMDEASWNGTANEVVDSSGNANHAQSFNSANTGATTPAIAGSPGTCRYGVFNNGTTITQAYVQTPLPQLTADFTVTAWIRTTNNTYVGSRIFADDLGGSDGYGFSIDDGAGHLRFYSRGITPIVLNSTYTIANNTWYFVAAVADITNKIRTIYVFDSSGTLLNTTKDASAFTGTWTADTGAVTIGGSSPYFFQGNLDEVRVYQKVLSQNALAAIATQTHVCPINVPDHIRIEHDGSAISCSAEALVVKACANAACSSLYTGGVTGNLTAGSNSVAFSIPSGQSQATVNIHLPSNSALADPQTVRLGTSSVLPVPTNAGSPYCSINAGAANNTTACDVSVYKAGFLFDVPHLTSGTASGTVNVSAVRSSDSSTCVPLFQNVTRTVSFWGEYQNPVSGTLSLQVNGSNIETTATPAYTSTYSLDFGATGVATLTSVQYDDVGLMRLNARYVGSTGNTPPDGGMIVLGSDTFVVKPDHFDLSNIKRTSDNFANPGAASASDICGGTTTADCKFVKAGESFTVTVTAKNALGNTTKNYGKETAAESVKLTSALVAGLGLTNNPAIGGTFGAFTDGVATGTAFTWNEVGIIKLTPSVGDGDYLGAGDVSGTQTGNVGRFYAAKFALLGGVIANRTGLTGCAAPAGCGTFTYMGEQMSAVFALTAKAADGTTTLQNYNWSATPANRFAKLDPTAAVTSGTGGPLGMGAVNSAATRTPFSPCGVTPAHPCLTPAQAAGTFASGVADITVPLTIYRDNAAAAGPYAVLDIGVAPQDSDGVVMAVYDLDTVNVVAGANNHAKVGQTEARYGRMKLSNAHGSELLPLSINVTAQYWDATTYVTNTLDNNSTFAATDVIFSNYQKNLNATNYPNSGATIVTPASVVFVNGVASYKLAKPGAGNNGSVDMTVSALSAYLPSNTARATFGVYKGNNEFIYLRENY